MAANDLRNITGKDITIRRQSAPNAVLPYDLIAAAKTKQLQYVNELGETTTHNPDSPNAVPWRTSLLVSRSWTLNVSGNTDMKRLGLLRADATTAVAPARYQIEFAGAKADGGGSVVGDVWVENLQVGASNMGVSEFSCQLRGEGAPLWQEAAA